MCTLSLLRIFLFSTLAQLCAAGLTFFLSGLDETRLPFAVLLLPIVACTAIARAYRNVSDQDKVARPCPRFTYPVEKSSPSWRSTRSPTGFASTSWLRGQADVQGHPPPS